MAICSSSPLRRRTWFTAWCQAPEVNDAMASMGAAWAIHAKCCRAPRVEPQGSPPRPHGMNAGASGPCRRRWQNQETNLWSSIRLASLTYVEFKISW